MKKQNEKSQLLGLLLLAAAGSACAQILPTQGTSPSAPDALLFDPGPAWYYRAAPSPNPRELVYRKATPAEEEVVIKAQAVLANTAGKALALVSGNEVVWHGYKPPATSSRTLHGFSIGKTVTAMAVGKAICQGKLKLDTVTADVLPELKATDLGAATVRDLLRMSSGTWEGNRDSTVWSKEERIALDTKRSNWLEFLVTSRVGTAEQGMFGKRKPGADFAYRSTDPLTLGVMLGRVTGSTYTKWVEKEVLHAAGTASTAVIGQDHFELGQADGTVRMTFEDWIRFGIFVKESQTAPGCFGDFVREATKTQITDRTKIGRIGFLGYGYLTWVGTLPMSNSYWAVGHGGQRVGWSRDNNRMVVAFSNVENYMDELYKLHADWARLP